MVGELELKMSELLCSRLCHDLISPIGAINNGLEFLQDDSADILEDATALIGNSAQQAADRLAFFRLAMGAGGSGDHVEFETVTELIENLAAEKKTMVEWSGFGGLAQDKIDKAAGKLLLNLSLIASDCLPRGGQVTFDLENNTQTPNITMSVQGEKCGLRDDVKTGFDEQIDAQSLTVRNVLAFYCINLAINCQKTLKLLQEFPPAIVFEVS